jgi:predicted nucleic acid-binding protein
MRWNAGEFTWLFTEDILEEYAEKLLELGIAPAKAEYLLAELELGGERVKIHFFHLHHYPVDADDTAFLLAALNGDASHLVTYDAHLNDVSVFYPEFITCEPLAFLADIRP